MSGTARQYLELTKPRVVALIVFTAVIGMFLATPGWPPLNAVLFAETVTEAPPVGAADDNVTVQLELLPDTTDAGEHWSPVTVGGAGGVTVTVEVFVLPFHDAVTVTV